MSAQALPGPWAWGRRRPDQTDGNERSHHGHRHHQHHRRAAMMWAEATGPEGPRGERGRGRRGGHGPGFGPGGGFGPGFGPGFGGGPGFGPGRGRGRGPKVGRGDVRNALLALLAEAPMHGYQMITELAERSGGAWRPSPGSVYPVLQLLADEGLVRAEETDGRRVFHLTDAGRERVAARKGEPLPWETAAAAADEGVTDLRTLAFTVGAAVMQVASAGTDAQIAAAREVLSQTRRSLYRILAEDSPADAATTDAPPADGPTEPKA